MADPPNALLGYADETNACARCANDQIWIAVWDLVRVLAGCSHYSTTWGALMGGSLLDFMPCPKRLSSHVQEFQAIWATGDEVRGRCAPINWATQKYVVEDIAEFLEDINPMGRNIIISDVVKLASTSSGWVR